MFQNPLISVIVLHDGRTQSLPEILSGLRKQSYQHVETIVVDADTANTNQVDVLAGLFPEVRFLPFFGEPAFMPMLAAGSRMVKGAYCFVISVESQLPRATIEMLLQYMLSHQGGIRILGLHTFASGYYWRRVPSPLFPWILRTEQIVPTDVSDSLHSRAVACSSAFMVSAQSLPEICGQRGFRTAWGIYYWQLRYCRQRNERGIAPGISIKLPNGQNSKNYIFSNRTDEALSIIHTLHFANPWRYCNYICYFGFKILAAVYTRLRTLMRLRSGSHQAVCFAKSIA